AVCESTPNTNGKVRNQVGFGVQTGIHLDQAKIRNQVGFAPEISCLATQIPTTIATSILGDLGQLGVGVHAAQGSQVASSNQQGAIIRIDVENEEKETDKEEQTRSEVIKSLDKGDDMQTNVKGAEEFGVEKLGSKEVTVEQIKGKGIEIQADCQGEGKSGKNRDGFMKDARQAIGAHSTGRGTTSLSNANKKINAGQVKKGGKGTHITGITNAGNGGHTKGR
ncbi:hypothetical protein FRX31_018543, partial [Thalictrum thalictroides]